MSINQRRLFYLLIVSSVLMFASIFSMSYRILGIGMLQWVIVVYIAFSSVWRGRLKVDDMSEYNFRVAKESYEQKKYGKALVYASVMPLMGIGLLLVGIMIFTAIVFG